MVAHTSSAIHSLRDTVLCANQHLNQEFGCDHFRQTNFLKNMTGWLGAKLGVLAADV